MVLTSTLILTGVLALAAPGVLERVEMNRIGWSLPGLAGPGVAKLAVEDCNLLGRCGRLLVSGLGWRNACVVDCQNRDHRPRLSELGLLADVNLPELGGRRALLFLRR